MSARGIRPARRTPRDTLVWLVCPPEIAVRIQSMVCRRDQLDFSMVAGTRTHAGSGGQALSGEHCQLPLALLHIKSRVVNTGRISPLADYNHATT